MFLTKFLVPLFDYYGVGRNCAFTRITEGVYCKPFFAFCGLKFFVSPQMLMKKSRCQNFGIIADILCKK